jgi:hypothetical protein
MMLNHLPVNHKYVLGITFALTTIMAATGCCALQAGAQNTDSTLAQTLEIRSLEDVEGTPIKSMLVPRNWNRVGGDRTESDFDTGDGQISFSLDAPKSEPLRSCAVNGFYSPDHREISKLCAGGPQLIFSSDWPKEADWSPKDKRYQAALRELTKISRTFAHSYDQGNQILNPKSRSMFWDTVAVEQIGGKLVLTCKGEYQETKEYFYTAYIPYGSWADYRISIVARSKKDFEENRSLAEAMLKSIKWTK